MNSHERKRYAIKRSVHFVLTNAFADSLKGVSQTFTKEFWSYLDNQNSDTRKALRNKAWKVWSDSGVDILSTNFTQGTLLVVSRRSEEFVLSLKEVAGELTDIRKIRAKNPIGDDPRTPENDDIFEKLWSDLIYHNGSYPSNFRPVTASVAQMIAARTGAPLPVVCAGINKKFSPSEISNGLVEMTKKSMPDEVFEESLVNAAINDGIAERVGEAQNFTFKVKRNQYREWIARVEARKWQTQNVAPEGVDSDVSEVIDTESEEIE
jgi:hypothetical protein